MPGACGPIRWVEHIRVSSSPPTDGQGVHFEENNVRGGARGPLRPRTSSRNTPVYLLHVPCYTTKNVL